MRNHGRVLLALATVALLLALGGCMHVRQEITLLADKEWQVDTSVTVPASSVEVVGAEALEQSRQDIADRQEGWKAQGIDTTLEVRQEANGDWVYLLHMEGKGWDLLNEVVFEAESAVSDAEGGRIALAYDVGDSSALVDMGGSMTVVIHAGQVHSSNADQVSGGTATWSNPTRPLEGEFSPIGGGWRLPFGMPLWLSIVLVALLVVLLVAVVLVLALVLRRRRPPAVVSPPPPL